MQNLVFTQLSIPEVRQLFREEIQSFFENKSFPVNKDQDEIGRGAKFASSVIGKAVPTIYALVSSNDIPHSKQGKDLYFSRRELEEWVRSGKRTTQKEAAEIASNRAAFA